MSTVKINTTEFNLYSYYLINDGISLTMLDTTIEDVEKAVDGVGTIEITYEGIEEARYNGMTELQSISKRYGMPIDEEGTTADMVTVVLHRPSLEKTVVQNTNDIEMISEAVEDLAELIGGE